MLAIRSSNPVGEGLKAMRISGDFQSMTNSEMDLNFYVRGLTLVVINETAFKSFAGSDAKSSWIFTLLGMLVFIFEIHDWLGGLSWYSCCTSAWFFGRARLFRWRARI